MTSLGVVTCILVLMCCCWDPSLATTLSCSFTSSQIEPEWNELINAGFWYPKYVLPPVTNPPIDRIALKHEPNNASKLTVVTQSNSSTCENSTTTYDIIGSTIVARIMYLSYFYGESAFVRVNSGTLAVYRSTVYYGLTMTPSVYVYTSDANASPDIAAVETKLSNDCSVFNSTAGSYINRKFTCSQ